MNTIMVRWNTFRNQTDGVVVQKLVSPSPEGKPRKRLFWILGAVVLVVIMILGLVLGLVLGLRHTPAVPHGGGTTGTGSGGATNINTTVDLGYAQYVGEDVGDGISTWFGIRYAATPIGNLRFRGPADPPTIGKTVQANTHSPICHGTPSKKINPVHDEDCLFLDIYAPSVVDSPNSSYPVFVMFQGGGFNTLSNPNLNGTQLASHDIVVVTFNYRVGLFGFLASQEIQADGNINAGLLDQRKVLQWVQKYIHLFGGNPKHVVIGGNSAGAASVDLHLTAYGGRDDGLFHAAAAESQSFGAQLTVKGSQYQYDDLVVRLGCASKSNTLGCLRGLSAKEINANNTNIPTPGGGSSPPLYMYSNVIDGTFTQDYTYNAFASGKYIKVPVIFGDSTNEGTIFTPDSISNYSQMNSFLTDQFARLNSSQLSTIDGFYHKAEQFPGKGAYWRTAANAYGEMRYTCPGLFISTMMNQHGVNRSWNYHWDVLTSENAINGLGVQHTAELLSIWGTSSPLTSTLIPVIQNYWVSFIKMMDPNKLKLASAPTWKPYTDSGRERVHFVNDPAQTAMEVVDAGQMERCKWFWKQGPGLGM